MTFDQNEQGMKVLICGSRYKDAPRAVQAVVRSAVQHYVKGLPHDAVVISGGAPGVDSWASEAAKEYERGSIVLLADWEGLGRTAGYVRNGQMLDLEPDLVVAFWDGESKGTKNTIAQAGRRGIPVDVRR